MTSNEKILKEIEFLTKFITPERYERIDRVLTQRTRYITVVLENIYHPHNASATIRNCDSFGVQDMHVIENSYKYNVNKDVAQGANKWVSLSYYKKGENNTEECLKNLKSRGYKIVATSPDSNTACTLGELSLDSKLALCFGTEETGLSEQARNMADYFVRIPMYGFSQSLNISVCAALSLYTLIEKLKKSEINWQLTCEESQFLKREWFTKSIKNSEILLKRLHQEL